MTKILFTLFIAISNQILAQWETVYFSTSNSLLPWLNAVEFRDFNTGFAVGGTQSFKGCVLRTGNNGSNWDTVMVTIDTLSFNDVTLADTSTIFAVGARSYCCNLNIGVIAKTSDMGNTWTTTMTNVGLSEASFPTVGTGYIAGNFGTVLKTVNSGNSWTYLNTGISGALASVFFINNNVGFACGGDTILKTIDGGAHWTSQGFASGNGFNKIFFPSDSLGYCKSIGCGDSIVIYKTIDQGDTWSLHSIIHNTMCFASMFFTSNSTGYVAGQFNLSKTVDGGITWAPQTASAPGWTYFFDDLRDVNFINADTGFAVGNNQFYRTKSGGGLASISKLNDQTNKASALVYPNPTSDQFVLDINTNDKVVMTLYDVTGKNVLTKEITGKSNIDISKLSEGVYSIILTTKDSVINKKLLIVR